MLQLGPVPRVATLSREEFLRDYKRPARPVVMSGLTRDWPARRKWTPEYLRRVAGERPVPLYDSKPARGREHQHAPTLTLTLAEYFDRLEAGENDLRMFFYNLVAEVPGMADDFRFPELGLRFFRKLPVLFAGGKGARVQMHFDIDLADICLCHFGGRKRVMLFSPDQTRYMYRVPFSFSSLFDIRWDEPDFEKYPALKRLRGERAVLEHGDVLYIPPGWWHFVEYDDISFSMALRAFPREPRTLLAMLHNLIVLRTVEGLMRRFVGQAWVDRNERLAVERTHRWLAADEAAAAADS